MKYKLLKNIAQITMGQSPDSSSYNEEEKGLPFYQENADFCELYPTAITIKNEAEKNYVYHLLKTGKTDLNSKGTGSTFKAIGKSVLEEVQVPVVSREQQEIIMQLADETRNHLQIITSFNDGCIGR